MPDVRNCRKCGKIFNYIGGMPICPVCKDKEEEDFKKVKEYLYQNPGATMSEVSQVLDVSVERIKAYLKDGRLEIVGDEANIILECEACGKSIKTGRFCNECQKNLSKEFRNVAGDMGSSFAQAESTKKGIGMRYLNKNE
ncbi:MAG: MerR family transcriptional regulator [Bacillota bacterium]|nr:MerR family transcriptional regulator [Bacillota bacterium]